MDEAKLNAFMGKVVNDMGGAAMWASVLVGDELGLYRAMAGGELLTAEELAKRTNCNPRLVREWLCAQAAAGYVETVDGRFRLPEEQAMALADEDSPVYVAGGAQVLASLFLDKDKIVAAMRGDGALAWGDHHPCLFRGTERFFRTGYRAHLLAEWLPALEGVVSKLEAGATVADVGCGHGISTIIMAEAYPASRFFGFDFHAPSIDVARTRAAESGVADRVTFEVRTAKNYPAAGYDLICFFDCLHDMGDPVGAARHAYEALAPDGTVLLVEPFAGDRLDENLTPVGRMYYAASTFICTPNSLSQEVGLGLGAQAGEARLREVFAQAGFSRFRRATETPFNLILEARK
ncbi:MAG TPA: class I SAM-dependent methyltransferase [Vicinamibacterales bacterium]|nr:class I SAM-dependent methyltransferase [Vicinamibacterales bacterium]